MDFRWMRSSFRRRVQEFVAYSEKDPPPSTSTNHRIDLLQEVRAKVSEPG